MADLEGSSWIDIDAPIERCFEIIADVERAPAWQGAMQRAHALEYDARRRPILVETHIHAIVANVTVWLRFEYLEPTGMRWTRERGDLRSLSGAWQLDDLRGGRTRATYSLEIGLNRTLGLLRKGVRGPAETKVRELLTDRPVEGLKREAER
jgi:Polyketide cyclase / dehydrase and lipid transport